MGCFRYIQAADRRLQILFNNIPIRTDSDMLVRSLTDFGGGFDRRLDDFFRKVDQETLRFMESGDVYLDFKVYRREDLTDMGVAIDMFDDGSGNMLLRLREEEELDIFVHFYHLSDVEKRRQMAQVISVQLRGPDRAKYIFDPVKARKAILDRMKVDLDVPAGPNGLAPDYDTVKHILVDDNPVVHTIEGKPSIIDIPYTSRRESDFKLAYERMGFTPQQIAEAEELYVWHHLDNWDPVSGQGTMQLVLKSVHNSAGYGDALNHTGGVAMWKWFYLINYR